MTLPLPATRRATSTQSGFFPVFCFIPEGVHLGEIRLRRAPAVLMEPLFNVSKPAAEFCVGVRERRLRIDVEVPGDICHHEQEIAEFFPEFGGRGGVRRRSVRF